MIDFATSESRAAEIPVEARGRYVAAVAGESWSVVIGRRWVAVSSTGDRVRSRYWAEERDGGVRITTIPTRRDAAPIGTWWLVTGGEKRYLLRDGAQGMFCSDLDQGWVPQNDPGWWLQQESGLGGRWSEPTGPDWLTTCRVPEGSRWSGTVVPGVPGAATSDHVVFQAAVTDHLFEAYGGAVCGIDDESFFVTVAIGGPSGHAPTVEVLAKVGAPLPVGTVVELHGGEVGCPESIP